MKIYTIFTAVFLALAGANAIGAEGDTKTEAKPNLLKRGATVDKPIADTYEPLNSTYVEEGEKLNEDIEQSWQMKKRAQEQADKAARPPATPSAERRELEQRIQEPGSGSPNPPLPKLEKDEKSIRISEP